MKKPPTWKIAALGGALVGLGVGTLTTAQASDDHKPDVEQIRLGESNLASPGAPLTTAVDSSQSSPNSTTTTTTTTTTIAPLPTTAAPPAPTAPPAPPAATTAASRPCAGTGTGTERQHLERQPRPAPAGGCRRQCLR